jgi:hypothetical protein
MRKIILLILVLLIPQVEAKHVNSERYYQEKWCNQNNGIAEYILPDKTRIDCLTKKYAIEFDFAPKWAEAIGQSMYYSKVTNKKPAICLIIKSKNDYKYVKRIEKANKKIKIFIIKENEF